MIVAIAALEDNLINPEDLFECNGFYELEQRKFHCWKYSGHGSTDLLKGIEESCDVYFYNLAERIGIERIAKTARKFGIGITPNLPLSGISKGLLPSKSWKKNTKNQSWFTGDTLNSGIGQGYLLSTPIQIAIMTARIATGLEIKPSLLKAIDGKPVKYDKHKLLDIKKSTLDIIRQAMFGVVNNKTGTAFNSRLINETKIFAGKTGTSQIRQISEQERNKGIIKNQDLPRNQRDHALFTGYAPFTNPKFSVSIVVEHGGSGGKVAAPIARDILLYALNGALPSLQEYPAEERNKMNSIINNIKREMISI
jgi:penicillin-binding protein 2